MWIEISKFEKGEYRTVGHFSLEMTKEIEIKTGKCKDIFDNVDWEYTSSKKNDNCIRIIFSNGETATFTHNDELQIRYINAFY